MNDQHSHAGAWLAKAANDLLAARRLTDADGPYDAACFHAQQAAEKALKAVLADTDAAVPRTHNLEDLQALCLVAKPDLPSDLRDMDLSELTPFAVELRYDLEFAPDRAVAEEARDTAASVVDLVRTALSRDDGA